MANFFPRWTNWLPLKIVVCGIVIVCGLTASHVVLRDAEIYPGEV